jgi:glycosyltransferase 2 family protein
MRDVLRYAAGVVLAVLLLWFVLRGVDRHALVAALGRASFFGLLAAAVVNLAHNVFRVWRWGALLAPVRPGLRFRPMFTAVIIGYLTTWILPGRLGELVRPALLTAREEVPIGPSLGSIVADRVLDGAAIVALFALGTFLSPIQGSAARKVRSAAVVLLLLVVVFMIGAIVAGSVRGRIEAWTERRGRFVRWCGRAFASLSLGTDALRRPRLLAIVLGHSLLAWLTIAAGAWIGVRASGADVSFPAMMVMLLLLAFGVAVPTPGGAGGYHAAMAFGLQMLFGVPAEAAVAAGILMHLAAVLPVIVLGLALLKTEGISWGDVLAAARGVRALGLDAGRGAEGGAA